MVNWWWRWRWHCGGGSTGIYKVVLVLKRWRGSEARNVATRRHFGGGSGGGGAAGRRPKKKNHVERE